MKGIGKIIFNELASRRAVILPEVGTLYVESGTADAEGSAVGAPVNRVEFSHSKRPKGSRSVVTLIEDYGIEREKAEGIYGRWLAEARSGDTIDAGEAGTLREGVFHPSAELERILNPDAYTVRKVKKPMCRAAKVWIGIGVAALLLAGLCIWYFNSRCYEECRAERALKRVVVAPAPKPTPQPEAQPAAPAEQKPTAATASGVRWHVVGGVFSVPSNADRFIEDYGRHFPGHTFEKIPYQGGKTLVSIYSAASEEEAKAYRRRMARERDDDNLWVYKAGR